MEEYIVSARKYRPATFDTVVGQRALTTTLLNAIKTKKLAHAYLFCGPRGVGKTTCARIFAKTINCLNPKENMEACDECESCKAFNEQRSMNIHELDAASNNSVDDIRELISQVQVPPQIGRYKVFIIDEVHMLSTAAFNAFLKTLEEPPSYVIFILATTEKHKILPTILSRCQVYDFARMTIQGTVDHLAYVAEKEGYKYEQDALNLIAQKADGGMRDALSIFDQMVSFTGGNITYQATLDNLNVLDADYYFRFVDHFLKAEVEPCMLLFNELINKGFDGGNFIGGLATHLRNVMVSRDASTLPLLEVSDTMKTRYQEQAQRCNPKFLYKAIKLCNDCDQGYKTSRNKRLQVEICLIQLAQLTQDDDGSAGHCPTKILKPIFKHIAAQVVASAQQTTAQHVHSAPAATQGNVVAEPIMSESNAVNVSATSQATSRNTTTPLQQSSPLGKTSNKGPQLRTISLKGVGPSLGGANKSQTMSTQDKAKANAQAAAEKANANIAAGLKVTPLDEHLTTLYWREFSNRLPKDEMATKMRMDAIIPEFIGDNNFIITVLNEQVRSEFEQQRANIIAYYISKTNNTDIKMEIKVAEKKEIKQTMSKTDIYKEMLKTNPELAKLQRRLTLEIS